MDIDAVLALLKIVGAAVGGILGIAGLLADFHNASGRLSKAGYWVLAGIVLAMAAGVGGSVIEGYKAKSDSVEQANRTQRLLHEINRTLQPITRLQSTYWVEIPRGDPVVERYIDRLSKGVEARLQALREIRFPAPYPGLSISASDVHDEPWIIDITEKSDLWPKGAERLIGQLAREMTLAVFLLKSPINPETFQPIQGTVDLSAGEIFPKTVQLAWDRKRSRLSIFATTEYSKGLWNRNGRLNSILDLPGIQIFFIPPHTSDFRLPERYARFIDERLEKLARSIELTTVRLSFAEGQSVWLHRNQFRKTRYIGGYPMFSVVLPTDEGEFNTFTASRDED